LLSIGVLVFIFHCRKGCDGFHSAHQKVLIHKNKEVKNVSPPKAFGNSFVYHKWYIFLGVNITIMLAGSISHPRNPSKKFFGPFHTQEILQKSFLGHFTPKKSSKKVFWSISHPRNPPKKIFGPFRTQEIRQKSFLAHFAPKKCVKKVFWAISHP